MAPDELPLRCLAVRVAHDATGEIDGFDLEAFMNATAGPNQWISTTEWLFVESPPEAGGEITVPVVVPEASAIKAVLNDVMNAPQRILFDHATSPGETRKWRHIAFLRAPNRQAEGRFPWEAADA